MDESNIRVINAEVLPTEHATRVGVYSVPHDGPHEPTNLLKALSPVELDHATGFEAGVMESKPKHLGHDVVDEVPEVVDGFVTIPTRPGIGIDLLPDAEKIRPPMVNPIKMRPHKDGFVVDQ